MDVGAERITFWFGCNMLRHAEMIRLSIMLLERVGYDVSAAGGPAYCCGTAHDHQPRGASNMAARTVARFNEAAEREGRNTVVTWCPSCHMHMADIMSPGNAAAFDRSRGCSARSASQRGHRGDGRETRHRGRRASPVQRLQGSPHAEPGEARN